MWIINLNPINIHYRIIRNASGLHFVQQLFLPHPFFPTYFQIILQCGQDILSWTVKYPGQYNNPQYTSTIIDSLTIWLKKFPSFWKLARLQGWFVNLQLVQNVLKSFSPSQGMISTMQQERKPVSLIISLLANDKEYLHSFQKDSTFVMIYIWVLRWHSIRAGISNTLYTT